jgi:hypothetical protein
MPKKMTIEELAGMTKRGFNDLQRNLASKDDVHDILRAIDGLELKISSYASGWTRDFKKLHEWMKEHEERLTALENVKNR